MRSNVPHKRPGWIALAPLGWAHLHSSPNRFYNRLCSYRRLYNHGYTHTHTRLTALFPGLPGWASARKVRPIWILLKQETVSGSGISSAICKSAPRSRQITMPACHHSVYYRLDAFPVAQPTASKHWRQTMVIQLAIKCEHPVRSSNFASTVVK